MLGRSWFGDSAKKTLATSYNRSRLFSPNQKYGWASRLLGRHSTREWIFVKGNTFFNVESQGGFRVSDSFLIPKDDNHVIDSRVKVGVHSLWASIEVL